MDLDKPEKSVRDNTATTDRAVPPITPKPGAPAGNANRRKHGARGVLSLSRGKKGEGHVRQSVYKFRRELEAQTVAIHGPLTLNLEGLILTACRAELAIKLYEAWGRKPDRTELESLEVCEKVLAFSDRRDRCIKELLGKVAAGESGSAFDVLDRAEVGQ